jgi:uncharacterized membrane protein YkvA (DUF1232 family)
MSNSEEKKEKKYNDFYQRLRIKINRWVTTGKLHKKTGRWTDKFMQYLLVFPDLVHLMIKLFGDKGTPARIKGYIVIAFTYLISPIDIIPDFIPAAGFIDDLLVLVIIMNKIINSVDEPVLERIKSLWAGEADVFIKVKEITETMNALTAEIPRSIYNFMKNKK